MNYLSKFAKSRVASAVRLGAKECGYIWYQGHGRSYKQEPLSRRGDAHHGNGEHTAIIGTILPSGKVEIEGFSWVEWGR